MIDYIFVPGGLANSLCKASVLRKAGKRVQLIPDSWPRDYIPLFLKLQYAYRFPSEVDKPQWDRDALLHELPRGGQRQEILEAVADTIAKNKQQFEEALGKNAPEFL